MQLCDGLDKPYAHLSNRGLYGFREMLHVPYGGRPVLGKRCEALTLKGREVNRLVPSRSHWKLDLGGN